MQQKLYLLWKCALILVSAAALCSCGVQQQKGKNKAEKVSVEKVREDTPILFKNSETTIKKHRLENDHIRIWWTDSYNDDLSWMQENLDGSGQTQVADRVVHPTDEVSWLTNDWLYCFAFDNDDQGGYVYRIPIDYDKKPIYDPKNREDLFLTDNIRNAGSDHFLVTDDQIVIADDEYCYQYDFQTKEVKEYHENRDTSIVFDTTTDMPVVMENHFFMMDDDGMYLVAMDTMEKALVYSYEGMNERIVDVACSEDTMYFMVDGDDEIMQFHAGDTETSVFLGKKDLENNMGAMELADDDALKQRVAISDIAVMNGRIYMSVYVTWNSMVELAEGSRKGEQVEMDLDRYALLSADLKDVSRWDQEDGFSDFLRKHAAIYYEDPGEFETWEVHKDNTKATGNTIFMVFYDGKAYFVLTDDENGNDARYSYDLETKEVQKIKKGYEYDALFFED